MILSSPGQLIHKPSRIISLVPSQTELLYHLGLEKETIAITKFCIHPRQWFRNKTRIGGTKQLHLDKIRSLQPDLIIANKEENVKEQIELLAQDFPVWVTDVNNLNQAYEMIIDIGQLTHREKEAEMLNSGIREEFHSLIQVPGIKNTIPAVYLIWKDPLMTVGADTFISHMMELAGFSNVFNNRERYPRVTADEILGSGCRLLLLSSEPYPFKEKHIAQLQEILPGIKMMLVDGDMFSWYGSRLLMAPSYFNELHKRTALR